MSSRLCKLMCELKVKASLCKISNVRKTLATLIAPIQFSRVSDLSYKNELTNLYTMFWVIYISVTCAFAHMLLDLLLM